MTRPGIAAFRRYLSALREGSCEPPPRGLLAAPEGSEPLETEILVEARPFADRIEAARYLHEALGDGVETENDVGLWSWLSLFYFDEVCPARPDGTRAPGRDYRHILEPGYRAGHRHLLAGPTLVYRLHGEMARLLLCSRVYEENQFHHELASRQAFISNPSIIGAADLLYFDPSRGRPKRGALDPAGPPGSLRRFVDVLQQLEVNYDLYSMTPEAILDLLPEEFRRWRGGRLRLRRRRPQDGAAR